MCTRIKRVRATSTARNPSFRRILNNEDDFGKNETRLNDACNILLSSDIPKRCYIPLVLQNESHSTTLVTNVPDSRGSLDEPDSQPSPFSFAIEMKKATMRRH